MKKAHPKPSFRSPHRALLQYQLQTQHGLESQGILVKENFWPFAGVFPSRLVKRCTHRENLVCLEAPTSWDTKERIPSSGRQRALDRQQANSAVQFTASLGAQEAHETDSWIFSQAEGPVAPVTSFISPVLSTQFTAGARAQIQ